MCQNDEDNPNKKKRRLNEQINGLDFSDENDNNIIKYKLLHSGEPVILNVGGIKYSTSLSTLLSNTNSILHKIFDGRWSLKPCHDGSYFFDRSGELFKHILEYLRNNKLTIQYDITLINSIVRECEYFQLPALKSELLIQKTKSTILRQADVEFITKSFNESFESFTNKPFEISYENMIYTYNGKQCVDYDTLQGLDRLLLIILCDNGDRFAFYIHDRYIEDEQTDGFIFELDSALTGERRVRKKYTQDGYTFAIESEPIMFTATLLIEQENDEYLDCIIKTAAESADFVCECKWAQTDNDRTVFNGSVKRFEIFRIL